MDFHIEIWGEFPLPLHFMSARRASWKTASAEGLPSLKNSNMKYNT